jgi:hypothetical protein
MSRFYVGQRVRIKWSNRWPELAGREGQIVGAGGPTLGPYAGKPGWVVRPAGWFSACSPTPDDDGGFSRFCPIEAQLEPILYDGNQLVSWDACLWQPEGQAA